MARAYGRSDQAAEYRHLYKKPAWRTTRDAHLRAEPICRMCSARGLVNDGSRRMDGSPAAAHRRFLVCDHIEPHKGDVEKFFRGPFQTLCPDHHDITKQQMEARGYVAGCTTSGRPVDAGHPWNRRA